ncbi:hypothetical protein ARMGADRAFT_1036556 [Armillaria gallica]|uniref:Uncharacterized protein n=1 Tax=Armillaria gallica TaxID=47427 RepID=A0A2H3CQC4_ARMGA|nr:hypothetical protein ARMGADRAFT_1036556 [Armillaria gallica]
MRRKETDSAITSSTVKNRSVETAASVGVAIEGGHVFLGWASAGMVASKGEIDSNIISSTLKNEGYTMMVVSGSMGMLSTGLVTSRGKTNITIVSGALKNGGDEMMTQFCVAMESQWRDFSGDVARIGGRGIGNDGAVMGENGGYYHLQHPRKRGWRDDGASHCGC